MKTEHFQFNCGKILFHGICADVVGTLVCDWSASGFACRFCGDAIRVFFNFDGNPDIPVYLLAKIDGKESKHSVANSSEPLVFDNLDDGEHSFDLIRITEMRQANEEKHDSLTIDGIDITGKAPELLTLPKTRKHSIYFIGDSITNGWGVCNDGTRDCFAIFEEDFSKSYAALTCRAFDAEPYVCAVSGHGVVSDCFGGRSEPMCSYYPYATRKSFVPFDFKAHKPDVSVIALATNDNGGGVTEEEMVRGAGELIDLIRRDCPETEIVWLYGMMGEKYASCLDTFISERNAKDGHIYFVKSAGLSVESGETGGGWHPSISGQKRIAGELISYIKEHGII